ncbi:NUDIX domain-containing protein [Terribacillus halophilus]|uniref:NUDIX domain-containing protein n=1 Tax=Terribacillus halophilus TaxID=361279 RepID=UPI0009856092|nr:NUDIX domain-containing protein [Terribacillus halophilus]
MKKREFHRLSRAVIRHGDSILLAKAEGWQNSFLPGGHVEIGEGAEAALLRELQEELGMKGNITSFLGDFEHSWQHADTDHFELTHVFEVALEDKEIKSQEPHLQFFWAKQEEFEQLDLQPYPLIEVLRPIQPSVSVWRSTLKTN